MNKLVQIALHTTFCGCLAASAVAKPLDVRNPAQGRFVEDWAEIFLAGQKIGYAHSTMARQGDDIDTTMKMVMQLGRVSQPVKISLVQRTLLLAEVLQKLRA